MSEVKVSIKCMVYNHAAYLRDCLDGIVKQRTDFPFEAIIHDDASTDDSAAIIREYAEKYPDIIKPIYETENQYSKKDGSLNRAIEPHLTGKYISYCEGDDYWIDPLKLQKQFDFLEAHDDYVMCWSDGYRLDSDGQLTPFDRYPTSGLTPTEDVVVKGGLWMPTASLFFRRELLKDWPPSGIEFHIGDYPLQVHAADTGKVHYMEDKMVVYRFQSAGSWTRSFMKNKQLVYNHYASEFFMISKLIELTQPAFHYYLDQILRRRHFELDLHKGDTTNAVKHYLSIDKKYRPKFPVKMLLKNFAKKTIGRI